MLIFVFFSETKEPYVNMSVNTMSDITMTAVFEKVNEDYGAHIVWTSGGS